MRLMTLQRLRFSPCFFIDGYALTMKTLERQRLHSNAEHIGIYTTSTNRDKKAAMKKTTYPRWINATKRDTRIWLNRISK
jgi:hypothetical protein